jgi:hypothetical protein
VALLITFRRSGLAGLLLALVVAASASADPVTVNLRIEGKTRTLFEGPVTTDVRPFRFTDETTEHQCDGTDANGGSNAAPVATRGAVITAASQATPFSMSGDWFDGFGASFSEIGGESVAYDPNTNEFLAEYENWQFAQVGACADDAKTGDEDLFAYGTGGETLLKLSGPSTAAPGATVNVQVVDGSSGAPVSGATVDGHLSAADGTVIVGPYAERGDHALKATRDGAIRSNAHHVCVTDGSDGACGTSQPAPAATSPAGPDGTAPEGRIVGIPEQARFSTKSAPRELKGSVKADPSGLRWVQLRLTRRSHGRCWYFSGSRERFRSTRCGRSFAFRIGDKTDWSYLLPARLKPGRYVLDALAVDRANNHERLARGRNRIVFFVR